MSLILMILIFVCIGVSNRIARSTDNEKEVMLP